MDHQSEKKDDNEPKEQIVLFRSALSLFAVLSPPLSPAS
jgi:hypothetical protein